MNRSFLVPIEVDVVTPEELAMLASEIQDACEAAGLPLAGDVKPWENPSLTQAAPIAQSGTGYFQPQNQPPV